MKLIEFKPKKKREVVIGKPENIVMCPKCFNPIVNKNRYFNFKECINPMCKFIISL